MGLSALGLSRSSMDKAPLPNSLSRCRTRFLVAVGLRLPSVPCHMGPSIEHRSTWPHGSCPFPVCEQRAGFESAGGWQPVLIPRSQRDHPTSATFSLPEASPVHAGGERVAEGEFREAGYWDSGQKLPSPAHLLEGQN